MTGETVLRVFFEKSQAVVREPRLECKLQKTAAAVLEAGLFQRAAVQVYAWAYGEKLFGFAGITPREEEWLRSHDVIDPQTYERVHRYGKPLGGPVYFIPHEQLTRILPGSDEQLLASAVPWRGPGTWHPDDMLYCRLTSSDGLEMGNLTADDPFDGKVPDENTAALLAPFVALAAAVLEQELNRRRDTLTGCFNGACGRDEIERRVASGRRFALVFLDMDNLKEINDRDGHEAGDAEIVRVAERLRAIVADLGGYASRLHGDEFVAMLWTDESEEAVAAAIERQWAPMLPDVSFGVAVRRADESARELLRRAELAMYRSKGWRRRG